MSERSEKDERTIRGWRRVFTTFHVVFTGLAGLCALVSMLAVHCGWTRPVPRGELIDPKNVAQLRLCHRDLAQLLSDLHAKTFSLQARALKFETDPATEWRNWSEAWRHRWRAIGHRCRLQELSGSGASPEIDQMEPIHAALAELQLSYSEVVNRFVERYADRLKQLRKELSSVRSMIERRRRSRPRGKRSWLHERQTDVPDSPPVGPKTDGARS